MTRIGCRAHDYGKLPAAELAAVLHAKGYTGAQLAMPRGIAGIADYIPSFAACIAAVTELGRWVNSALTTPLMHSIPMTEVQSLLSL